MALAELENNKQAEQALPAAQAGGEIISEVTEVDDDGSMSLTAHLTELRSRLIKSLIAVALGSCVGYYFIETIMHYLTLPVGKLYFMQPSEAFFTYLKVSVFVGFLLALPVVFFHVWRFFLPALTVRERMVLGLIVPASVVLFFIGLAFSFFLVLPTAVKFFMGFGGADLEAMFSVGNYFDFVLTFLGRHFRIVIFLSFVIGAIITPTPDIFTQSMIALPMFLLYGVGYVIVRYVLHK